MLICRHGFHGLDRGVVAGKLFHIGLAMFNRCSGIVGAARRGCFKAALPRGGNERARDPQRGARARVVADAHSNRGARTAKAAASRNGGARNMRDDSARISRRAPARASETLALGRMKRREHDFRPCEALDIADAIDSPNIEARMYLGSQNPSLG